MVKKFLTLYLLLMAPWLFSQKLTFDVPTKIQAQIGQELSVKINVMGIQKYSIKMAGNPLSSSIQSERFVWTPTSDEAGNYFVKFILQDSLGVPRYEADMALSADTPIATPGLTFDRSLPDTIKVVENEPFFFLATLKSGRGSDPRSIMAYFLFNENADLRSFDSCVVNRMGDAIVFGWTPSNKEAIKGYAKFRITLVDIDNSVWSQVLNFKIKNININPSFRFEIPDTVFIPANGSLTVDFSATDPDHDDLKYDFYPKSPLYYLQGSKIIFNPDLNVNDENQEYPIHLHVSATDGNYSINRSICVMKIAQYRQPSIGDFTRKDFYEGDSLVTYLNISNDTDLKHYDIQFSDLAVPTGIGGLTSHLTFEKGSWYLKVRSKGILPYYLVDHDFTYNIAVTLSDKDRKIKPIFKVLELTVRDKPDPTSLGRQKAALLDSINRFVRVENIYKTNLEKIQSRINRPWWKKAAAVTGTLSGILSIVQSQDPKKSISIISAAISLMSITVTNLPSLNEKALSELNEKISNSKGRIDLIQEKESDFQAGWSLEIDRSSFDKITSDILARINKGQVKRKEDVCSLLGNKTLKGKIETLTKAKGKPGSSALELKNIFSCAQKPKDKKVDFQRAIH
jgi:hypothetical protein